MNHTDTASALSDGASVITTAHLAIIVLLIIAAVLVIWWGSRRRARERKERALSDGDTTVTRTAVPAPPVTPAPPPLVDEPPVVSPVPVVAETPREPVAPPPSASAAVAAGDDAGQPVTLLKGLGPKVAVRLGELGIASVGQLAALSPAEAEALDADLGAFSGRMARDRWVEQAKLLAAGDRATYEAIFGKVG